MNVRHYLRCDVCGAVILARTQVGHLDSHPIRIHCGQCGILISGKAFFNQEEATVQFEFSNAEIIEETKPDFYIEASGELITEKLQRANLDNELYYTVPPFYNSLWSMGNKNYEEFMKRSTRFIMLSKTQWPRIRRINELWLNGKTEYLIKQVEELLPKKQFPMNNNLEYLRGVHQLNIMFFSNILEPSFFKSTTDFLWKELRLLGKSNAKGLFDLAKDFGKCGLLKHYDEKVFGLYNEFVDIFQYILPTYGLRFYEKNIEEVYENKGITTASFEDLKNFYLDCYEVSGDMVRLIVAFNNLKYRNDYQKMVAKRKDILTISDFDAKSKGIRIEFISGTEDFDRLVYPNLDSKLRNAIGHNSYKYDGINQQITYYPSGNEDETDKNTKYLLEFCQDCSNIFQSLLNLSELVYQTSKLYYITQGCIPINPTVFGKDKKIGRNDPCPCGSGKKYKKCCGN